MRTLSSIVAAEMLLALAMAASAGTVNVTSGPTFVPGSAFSNNSIKLTKFSNSSEVMGDLLRISGDGTITPTGNSATVSFSGTFSAATDDLGSLAYSFTIDLSAEIQGLVSYTVRFTSTKTGGNPKVTELIGTVMPGLHRYTGQIAGSVNPVPVSGTFTADFTLNFTSVSSGTLDLSIRQMDFGLGKSAATLPSPSLLLNISTRLDVQTGDNVLIGGFIITGNESKKVILRAIGPSLGSQVAGALADPILELHEPDGTVLTNDNWKTSQQSEIEATGIPPTSDLESAIVATLAPGAYTAILRGVNNTSGVALVEAYDLNTAADAQLANISTRGFVQTSDNVMIGGFILGPDTNDNSSIVLRAIGPSLTGQGVIGALQDPNLEIHNSDGALIASNDNWMDSPDVSTIATAGLAPTQAKESALLIIPAPGAYTAIVSGVGGTTGVGLVEAYNLQ